MYRISVSRRIAAKGGAVLTGEDGPFSMVAKEMKVVREHIGGLVVNKENEMLDCAGKYMTSSGGKLLRPTLVAMMAHALVPPHVSQQFQGSEIGDLDDITSGTIRPFLRLGEVTELIHTAALIHDDVIDNSEMRRGKAALHCVYDVKRAVLAGDYLLARASLWIASLSVPRIVVLMSTALEDLTRGEIMQMEGCFDIERYEEKTYCKTGSLIANSLAAAAVLADPSNAAYKVAAEEYGRRLGIAFQIVDDCLDIKGDEENLGKRTMVDMGAGIATLPVLLAARKDARVDAAVRRRFKSPGDIELCVEAIERHGSVMEAIQSADQHCKRGIAALRTLHESPARDGLERAMNLLLKREL